MKPLELTIEINELQILLNKFEDYDCTFPVFPQFKLFKAFPVDSGYEIRLDHLDFDQFYTGFNDMNLEFPVYNDFKECFLASGCISYDNTDQFTKKYNMSNNFHKKPYLALDTNILYHRFISFSPYSDQKVLVSPTILQEIEHSINFKYNPSQIQELKKVIKVRKHLFNELTNCRVKKSRKAAYFAMNEWKTINSIKVDPINYNSNAYERNDLKIIKEFKNFQKETETSVIVLTADRTMIDFCIMEDVEYFLFYYPQKINIDQVSAHKFRNLIFNLAAIFGFIQLNSTIIYGEYQGKKGYNTLKIRFLDKKIFQAFNKDLQICRSLNKLNLEF